jgi:hypothetical protein
MAGVQISAINRWPEDLLCPTSPHPPDLKKDQGTRSAVWPLTVSISPP